MSNRTFAIMRKETWHILRDVQTLAIVLAMPVFMMFLYGYALDVNIRDVRVIIEDPNPSAESRAIIRAIDQSSLFKVIGQVQVATNPVNLFRQDHIKALIRFPTDFAAQLKRGGKPATIQVVIDGSDQNTATIIRNAVGPFLQRATLSIAHITIPQTIRLRQTTLYNPQQTAAQYFVPGLMVIILMMISALLTTLTITREKEFGTLEQLLISPLRPGEILLGKIAPYIVLAAIDGLMILLVGRFVFNVHIAGPVWLLSLASLIFIITALSFGLLVSTLVQKQIYAMLIVMPAAVLPTILLSGFIFPLSSMPLWLQLLSQIVPATYFLQISRGIILKGVGLAELWQPLAMLTLLGSGLLTIAIRKFKVR